MLLIVSMENDFHVDYLIKKMTAFQRKNMIVFKTESFPMKSKLVLGSSIKESYLKLDNNKIFLCDISSIWYRRSASPTISSLINNKDARKYAQHESQDALLALWESINDCLWVSKPSNIRNASHKYEQLLRAKSLGLNIPQTLITNDPDEARQFCYTVKTAVVKAVCRSVFLRGNKYEMAYTSPINYDDVRIRDVIFSPCIFQEYVPKQLELRITVVKNEIFACAIYSQKSEKTKHDWRNYDLANTPHNVWSLPLEIEKKCLNLVRSYNLNFGAIDMIITPENKYVFLELNPNGQWVWIENLTNLPISKTLINLLFLNEKS
ncbi:MAG: hypothetical protein HYW71_01915 [Candidatus Niyogibacteria bacterium]|nr:hypothetical protein [Candidatus Niyogibacteria bacterium]